MKKRVLLLAATAVSCFAIWLAISFASSSNDSGAVKQLRVEDKKIASIQPQTTGAPKLNSSNPSAVDKQNERINFLDRYNKATSYRAFLYDIARNPGKGGVVYFFLALTQCKQAADVIAAPGEKGNASRRAAAALATRCDMTDSDREAVGEQWASDRKAE